MPRKKSTKKTTAKKSTATKKGKLSSLSQAHGKDSDTAPRTLDQIWGDDGVWKYNTMNVDKYKTQLDEYNLTDLQRHASKLGIIPVESRARLQETLLKEFRKHISNYNVPADDKDQVREVSDEVSKILREGR